VYVGITVCGVSTASSVSVTGPTENEQNPGNYESFSNGTKTNGDGYSMCELKRNREREKLRKKEKVWVEHSQLYRFLWGGGLVNTMAWRSLSIFKAVRKLSVHIPP
jgi:hypothetical protein